MLGSHSGIWRGTIYGITAASIWGGMYVVSDVVLLVLPPFTLLSLRIALGLLVLLPIAKARGYTVPGGAIRWHLLAVGVIGLGISLGRAIRRYRLVDRGQWRPGHQRFAGFCRSLRFDYPAGKIDNSQCRRRSAG